MKIKIEVEAYRKLKLYIANVDEEISGLGYAKIEKNVITVYDVILLPQTNSYVSTDMFQGSIAKYLDDRMKKELPIENLHLWWHSHASMEADWSMKDDETINDFDTERPEGNWFLSIVGNHQGDLLCRLDLFAPFRYTINEIPWEIGFSPNKELIKSIKKEIKEKVNVPKPKKKKKNKRKLNLPSWMKNKENPLDHEENISNRGIYDKNGRRVYPTISEEHNQLPS